MGIVGQGAKETAKGIGNRVVEGVKSAVRTSLGSLEKTLGNQTTSTAKERRDDVGPPILTRMPDVVAGHPGGL